MPELSPGQDCLQVLNASEAERTRERERHLKVTIPANTGHLATIPTRTVTVEHT
jgi:hypothetical protein